MIFIPKWPSIFSPFQQADLWIKNFKVGMYFLKEFKMPWLNVWDMEFENEYFLFTQNDEFEIPPSETEFWNPSLSLFTSMTLLTIFILHLRNPDPQGMKKVMASCLHLLWLPFLRPCEFSFFSFNICFDYFLMKKYVGRSFFRCWENKRKRRESLTPLIYQPLNAILSFFIFHHHTFYNHHKSWP